MILVDAGVWVALGVAGDRHHAVARRALQDHANERLVTSWPVITEACHLLGSRHGIDKVLEFLALVAQNGCDVFELRFEHCARIAALMRKYRDLPMDLADASLVVAAEALGCGTILSTDARDFGVFRWGDRKSFKNLLPAP
ncbi:type II toxin-antitoxin system VapC family toxin [Panacagrimonas sp.]|uniref:type II toxin-antitoxin system VapC family toxin n=1 Tax=Panacagrimonas sp. TaxID=2480088 RepID=UPI003B524EF7